MLDNRISDPEENADDTFALDGINDASQTITVGGFDTALTAYKTGAYNEIINATQGGSFNNEGKLTRWQWEQMLAIDRARLNGEVSP